MPEPASIWTRHPVRMIWALAVLHFIITGMLGFIKILTFKTSFDLAVFNQIFWMITRMIMVSWVQHYIKVSLKQDMHHQ